MCGVDVQKTKNTAMPSNLKTEVMICFSLYNMYVVIV